MFCIAKTIDPLCIWCNPFLVGHVRLHDMLLFFLWSYGWICSFEFASVARLVLF
jgi:hypothetical protein